jgi:hypothetical protein
MTDNSQNTDSTEAKLSDFADTNETTMTDGGVTDEELMGGGMFVGPDKLAFNDDDEAIDMLGKAAHAAKATSGPVVNIAMSMRNGNAVYELKFDDERLLLSGTIEVIDSGSKYNLHKTTNSGLKTSVSFDSFEAAIRSLYQMFAEFEM